MTRAAKGRSMRVTPGSHRSLTPRKGSTSSHCSSMLQGGAFGLRRRLVQASDPASGVLGGCPASCQEFGLVILHALW
jgi:hypothetical protein